MIHIIGYIGLAVNLLSMAMKNILWLRILSAIANFLYVIYGIIIFAPPLVIGCAIAVIIHCYHIVRLLKEKKEEKEKKIDEIISKTEGETEAIDSGNEKMPVPNPSSN